MAEVEYYGAKWCGDCRRSKALLDSLRVEYDTFDVSKNEENADKARTISGRINIPVIRFSDGVFLVEPSDSTLKAELEKRGLIPTAES